MEMIGKWAFIAGLVIAVVAVLGFTHGSVPLILALIGIAVGFLNVGGKETTNFLLAAIGLMLSATAANALFSAIPVVQTYGAPILGNIVALTGAAVLVVSLRTLFLTARS
ncbi:MAG: hypothetical protein NUV51_02170 [Sulfuricaulis sp.]|nr:hypothetical protein [Sulfuricaulis sp.]